MTTVARRVQPNGWFWDKDTAAVAAAAWNDAAYCIDAPDEIPGGGMWADSIDTGYGIEFLPMPLMAPREGKAGT